MFLYGVFKAASTFLTILDYAIVLYCILSWFRPSNKFYYWLGRFVEPIMAPFRGVGMWLVQKTGLPLDISPVLALIVLSVANNLLWRVYYFLV